MAVAGAAAKGAYPSTSLYVGDLSPDVSEPLLFEIFNAVGPVASIRVCRDAMTRRSLGYAYVNFHNVADAERALDTMNFTNIANKPCRIMWSQRDPALRRSGVGNIFVKHLDKSIDHKSLYDTFSVFGNILSCKVSMDGKGESLGYGFVHYQTAEAAEKAIANVNGMVIAGQKVHVAHFKPRAERSGDLNKFTNVYIKNLPESFDKSRLEELFGKIGPITSSMLAFDKEGKFRGFAFVNYESCDDAKDSVDQLNGTEVEGKVLFVGRAMTKTERSAFLMSEHIAKKEALSKRYEGRNLYVKHLGDTIDDERLQVEFEKFGVITSAKVMKDNETGRSKGFGFVCFETSEAAQSALQEMQGKTIFDRKPLFVAHAQRREMRRQILEKQRTVPSAMYPSAPVYYPGGFPPSMAPNPRWAQGPAMVRGPVYSMVPGRVPRGAHRGRGGGRGRGRGRDGVPAPVAQVASGSVMQPTGATITQQLAQASPQEQKQIIGERLFPLIRQIEQRRAGKITGMLLEMDNSDLLDLLDSQEALRQKVDEAIRVLEEHEGVAEQ